MVPPLPTLALTPKPINVPLLPKFKCRDRAKKPPQAAQPAVPAAAATPTAGADDDDSADEDTPRPSTAPAPAASTKPLSFEPWPGALTRDFAAREVADRFRKDRDGRWAAEVRRVEAKTGLILQEQKKNGSVRPNNTPQTPKPKRALLEKLSFFSKSKKQSPSLTSSTQPETPSMVSAVSNDKKAVWNTVIVASERDPGEDDLGAELYDQLRSQHRRDHLPAQRSRYAIPEPSPQGKAPSCEASPSTTPAKPVHEEPIGPMPEPKPWFPSAAEHSARLRSQSAHSTARHPSNGSAAFFLAPSLASPSVPQTPSSANRPQRRAGPALMPLHTPPPHYPASCSTSPPQHRYPPRAMPFAAAKVSGTPLPRQYGRPCLPSPAATR